MQINYEVAIFYRALHEVLTKVSENFKDIEDMNNRILAQPVLDDYKDIEKTLSRTAVSTIYAIYYNTCLICKEKYNVDELEVELIPPELKEREKLIELFVNDSVTAFNVAGIEHLVK